MPVFRHLLLTVNKESNKAMKTYEEMVKIIDDGGSVFIGGEVIKDKSLLKDAMETEKTFARSSNPVISGMSSIPAPEDTATAELIERQKSRIEELEDQCDDLRSGLEGVARGKLSVAMEDEGIVVTEIEGPTETEILRQKVSELEGILSGAKDQSGEIEAQKKRIAGLEKELADATAKAAVTPSPVTPSSEGTEPAKPTQGKKDGETK